MAGLLQITHLMVLAPGGTKKQEVEADSREGAGALLRIGRIPEVCLDSQLVLVNPDCASRALP